MSPSICVFNPGSATIKWALFNSIQDEHAELSGQSKIDEIEDVLQRLLKTNGAKVFIIRFVHGGTDFVKPTLITHENVCLLDRLLDLAPLHNVQSLKCVNLLLRRAGTPNVIAVFDTEFFHDLPQVAQLYGLPKFLRDKYQIRRYGFHGFAHAAMKRTWEKLHGRNQQSSANYRLVTIQLGSGCSMAAIKDGQAIDTTMGFTPNEGLLMSTRCGDLDSGLLTWLQRQEAWSPQETDCVLNEQSGWLGMSGESADMADLLASQSKEARLAVELFIYRIRKTLGAFYALLGGLDGVVLSGGIAEHSAALCHRVLNQLKHLGIDLTSTEILPEEVGNKSYLCLSTKESRVDCWVVKNNEHRAMLETVTLSKLVNTKD